MGHYVIDHQELYKAVMNT